MIDSHCHLDFAAFDADRDACVERAAAAGVTGILVPGVEPATWPVVHALARRHHARRMRHAIGIHPQVVPRLAGELPATDAAIDALATRIADAATATGAIAIGECGLDGPTGDPALQERVFRAHLRAARALDLPLVIHVFRAHDAAPRILRAEGATTRGVLHSYSGGAGLVGAYARLGLWFSFAGPITYPNARRPIEAARVVPVDRLLVETDAPDQAPAAARGQRNEPALLPHVIAALADALDDDRDELADLTAANARQLFSRW